MLQIVLSDLIIKSHEVEEFPIGRLDVFLRLLIFEFVQKFTEVEVCELTALLLGLL